MSKDKKRFYTPKEIKEIEDIGASKGITLLLACLMDEFDYGRDDLSKLLLRLDRYKDAVDTKIITIRKIVDIIKEETNLPIRW